jgi:hypothetical protein
MTIVFHVVIGFVIQMDMAARTLGVEARHLSLARGASDA